MTKLIGYQESMVLIIYTKNASNLTNRYQDMVLDRQKDEMEGLHQNYIPQTSSGDNNRLAILITTINAANIPEQTIDKLV